MADLTGYKNVLEALDENPSVEVNKMSTLPEGEVATCSASEITASRKGVYCVLDQSFRASGAKV